MNSEQPNIYNLDELKKRIYDEIQPLIPTLRTPVDRFRAYEALLRDKWSDELAYKAFEEAQQIENPEDKFYSLQSLSSEIYFHTNPLPESQPLNDTVSQ